MPRRCYGLALRARNRTTSDFHFLRQVSAPVRPHLQDASPPRHAENIEAS